MLCGTGQPAFAPSLYGQLWPMLVETARGVGCSATPAETPNAHVKGVGLSYHRYRRLVAFQVPVRNE